jgi:hypothetical protein
LFATFARWAGAHYIEGGVDAALSFMKWLGLEVGVNLNLREQARMCSDWDRTLLESIDVIELEMLLDYRFNNKGLLVQALTHASCERSCGACYQVPIARIFVHYLFRDLLYPILSLSGLFASDSLACGSDWKVV